MVKPAKISPREDVRKSPLARPRNIAQRLQNGCRAMILRAGIAHDPKTPIICSDLAPSRSNSRERFRTESLTPERYAEKILIGPLYTITQLIQVHKALVDGAPCHSALLCPDIRAELTIKSIRYPRISLDLNSLKYIWCSLKNHIAKCAQLSSTKLVFFAVVEEAEEREMPP